MASFFAIWVILIQMRPLKLWLNHQCPVKIRAQWQKNVECKRFIMICKKMFLKPKTSYSVKYDAFEPLQLPFFIDDLANKVKEPYHIRSTNSLSTHFHPCFQYMPKRLCFQKNGRIPLHGTNLTWSTHKNNIYLQSCEKQLDILHCCLSRWCCCYLLVYSISDLQQRLMYSFDCRYKFGIACNIYSSGSKFIAKLQDAPCLDCDFNDK